mmetsp:Transcript_26322/g.88474  ORF Transcript_26322/g.88474 Transcript_26322/m.88474 type:complete len:222 (+) Transcript_26322:1044-1709(+)
MQLWCRREPRRERAARRQPLAAERREAEAVLLIEVLVRAAEGAPRERGELGHVERGVAARHAVRHGRPRRFAGHKVNCHVNRRLLEDGKHLARRLRRIRARRGAADVLLHWLHRLLRRRERQRRRRKARPPGKLRAQRAHERQRTFAVRRVAEARRSDCRTHARRLACQVAPVVVVPARVKVAVIVGALNVVLEVGELARARVRHLARPRHCGGPALGASA